MIADLRTLFARFEELTGSALKGISVSGDVFIALEAELVRDEAMKIEQSDRAFEGLEIDGVLVRWRE